MKTTVFAVGALQVQEQQLDQALAVFHIQEPQVIATSQSRRQKNSRIPLQRLSEKLLEEISERASDHQISEFCLVIKLIK